MPVVTLDSVNAAVSGLALRIVAETSSTFTLGWTPVPGCIGYRFLKDKKVVSHTWDPFRVTVKFSKAPGVYAVEAIMPGPSGTWSI